MINKLKQIISIIYELTHNNISTKTINTFDIDGVIYINENITGVRPGLNDFIITGRSYEEQPETIKMLKKNYIFNKVFFNPLSYDNKTRASSGYHKAKTINSLISSGYKVNCHFEDDEIQAKIIKKECKNVNVILVVHNLTEKENTRHI